MIDKRKIVSGLGGYICPTHREYAKFEVNGDDMTISTCCDNFRQTMLEKYKEELMKATKEELLKAFRR